MHDYKQRQLLDQAIISKILKPYWTKCVRKAELVYTDNSIHLLSHLGIDKPWYCDSTGHMNAIELNLAFNQMMYVTLGESIRLRWIPELAGLDEHYFMKKYWPDFLIVDIESKFKLPLLVNNFSAILRINNITRSTKHLWFELDLTAKPGIDNFPEPGQLTHAYSKMTLVIKDYMSIPNNTTEE